MALFTLSTAAGLVEVLEGSITLPLLGVWIAHLELGEDVAPELGPATLQIAREDGTLDEFRGTIVFSRLFEGRAYVQLVGGAGGLGGEARAVHYTAAPTPVAVRDLFADVVRAAGEQLAADLQLLGTTAQWTRISAESWARALTRIADHFQFSWRVLDSGLVWVGAESWPDAGEDLFVKDEDKSARILEVAFDRATLRPGMTIGGRKVVRVTFLASGHAEVELDDDAGDAFAAAVTRAARPSPHVKIYSAEVVMQHADGPLDVRVEEAPFRDLLRVPFDTGVLGARYVIPAGARVRVAFAAGEPSGAWAFGLPSTGAAARGVARLEDTAAAGTLRAENTQSPAPPGVVLSYQAPGSEVPVPWVTLLNASAVPSPASVDLRAVIDSASAEVLLR